MSETVKIVGTPYEEGQTKTEVRSALREAYPGFRVASILRDDERWLARLVESDRVHHKLADDDEKSDAPFPLKELGPEGESDNDSGDSKDDSSDDSDDSDSKDELKDDESSDDEGDEKKELGDLLKQFKKLLPALEKVVGPVDDEGPEDKMPEDIGPVPGGPDLGGPPPGGPPMGGPPGGPPPGAAPPRRPAAPPGAGRRPGGPPRPGVPTFTHRLQRTADVTEEEAKTELLNAYPDYEITDFQRDGDLYKVVLEPKNN